MRETASSIPDWGTGSGVLMSREITVRIGLVRRALVVPDTMEVRRVARASFVNLVAGILRNLLLKWVVDSVVRWNEGY